MLRFVWAFVSAISYLQAQSVLENVEGSFENVVRNAYRQVQIATILDVIPRVNAPLKYSIGKIAVNFEGFRLSVQPNLGQAINMMLTMLLESGDKELVKLYYYFADSRKDVKPSFFCHVTGCEWDIISDNDVMFILEVGKKIRPFTQALLGSSDSILNKIWVNPNDGWLVHQAWVSDLLNGQSSVLYEEYKTLKKRGLNSRDMPRFQEYGIFFPLGCFLAGMLREPLFAYFSDIFPQMAGFFSSIFNIAEAQKDFELHDALWADAWCNAHMSPELFGDLVFLGLKHLVPSERESIIGRLGKKHREWLSYQKQDRINNSIQKNVSQNGLRVDQKREEEKNRNRQQVYHNLPFFVIEGGDAQGSHSFQMNQCILNAGIDIEMLICLMDLCEISPKQRRFRLEDAKRLAFVLAGWDRWNTVEAYLDLLRKSEIYQNVISLMNFPIAVDGDNHAKDSAQIFFVRIFRLYEFMCHFDVMNDHAGASYLVGFSNELNNLFQGWGFAQGDPIRLDIQQSEQLDALLKRNEMASKRLM